MKESIILFLSVFILSNSQAQQTLSLTEAVDYGLKNSYQKQLSQKDLDAAEQKVKETTAMGLPQIDGSVNFKNFIDIPTTLVEASTFNPSAPPGQYEELQFGTEYNMDYGLSVSQLIFSGSYIVALKSSQVFLDLSRQQIERSELDVKEQVTNAYNIALIANNNISVLQDSYEILSKTLSETSELVKEGLLEEEDAMQLELTLNNLESQIAYAKNQEVNSKNMLKLSMGMPLATTVSLTTTLNDLTNSDDGLSIIANPYDLKTTIDYKMTETNLTAQSLLLKNEKSTYLPTLAGFFNYTNVMQGNEFDLGASWFPTTLWGLTLNVPIFSSGERGARVKQAQLSFDKAEIMQTQALQGLELQSENAKNEYTLAIETYKIQERSLVLSETIRNKTLEKYKEGLSSSFDLNQAESQFLSAKGNLMQATISMLTAKTAFQKTTGTL